MGNTVLRYLPLGKSGQVFFESFEADNWLLNEAWGTLNGSPASSSVQFKFGTKSFVVDSSFPLIQKDFSQSPNLGANCFFKVWFWDDASRTATAPVYALLVDGTGRRYGIGINDNFPTTLGKYAFYVNGSVPTSGVSRTTGWHSMTFKYTFNVSLVMTLDNGVSQTVAFADSSIFTKIQLGTLATTGTVPFGYFDYAQVANDWTLKFNGLSVGQKILLMSDLNNPFSPLASATSVTGPLSGSTTSLDVSNGLLFDSPINGYLMVTGADGIAPYFVSDLRSIFFGDRFVFGDIDFGRRASTFGKPRGIDRTTNISTSGKEENILFSSREPANLSIPDITDDQRRTLLAWWSQAQQGQASLVAIDSGQVFFAPIAQAATAGQMTLKFNTFYGRQIEKGATFLIYGPSGLYMDECKVSSMVQATGTANLAFPLNNSYALGTFVRSPNYWPMAICKNTSFPIGLDTPKVRRWNFTPNFLEAV